MKTNTFIALLTLLAAGASAQEGGGTLDTVVGEFQQRVDRVTADLAETRKQIETEKVPLTKKLNALEEEVIEARKAYDEVLQVRDRRTLDITNLKARIRAKQDAAKYVANLLDEFTRNSEGRLHQTEIERYADEIDSKRNASLNANLSENEKLEARLATLDLFVSRLEQGVGGEIFDTTAVSNETGVVHQGKVMLLGPLAYFSGSEGSIVGLADAQLNSASTVVKDLPIESEPGTIATAVETGEGVVPVDSTRGSAFKVEETKDTIADQFEKGGPVMYVIGGLGALAVLVGVLKWLQLALVRRPSNKRVKKFLAALDEDNEAEAEKWAKKTGGPVGRMMRAGAAHYRDPTTMMEEAMFESVLDAKTSLNSWIPFIKIAAAVEPLLGLLGTVTGMINTFKLITIFGTGDAQTFSSGISEALLTTMWGLITAIPCLLISAFLARKAKGALDDMEKLAVRLMNHRNHMDNVKSRGEDRDDLPEMPSNDEGNGKRGLSGPKEKKLPFKPSRGTTAPPPGKDPGEEDGGGMEPSPAT